jgi:hypothetical protein
MACHGVISAGFCRNRFCIKLEITPPSISNHSRYGTSGQSWDPVVRRKTFNAAENTLIYGMYNNE